MNVKVPPPGSREAIDEGCTCPVLDNCHGRGVPWPRDDGLDPIENPSFWYTEGCPVHKFSPYSTPLEEK